MSSADSTEKLQKLLSKLKSEFSLPRTPEEEINFYYDNLEYEILVASESAVEHLYKIRDEKLATINQKRKHLLDLARSNAFKVDSGLRKLQREIGELEYHLERICREPVVAESQRFQPVNSEIQAVQEQVFELTLRLKSAERRLKTEMFNGEFLKFLPNDSFFSKIDHLGRFKWSDQSTKPFGEKEVAHLKGHESYVSKLLFMANGNLISCSNDKTIKIWDYLTGQVTIELKGIDASSLVLLQNNLLACGSLDHSIVIWNLIDRKITKTLKGHTDQVISLQMLPNANLLSCSWDDTIRIWNPYLKDDSKNSLLLTISGHGNLTHNAQSLGILSNGYLASCFDEKVSIRSLLKIWDSLSGECVKTVPIDQKGALTLLVLKNDSIIIGFNDGSLRLVDLIQNENSRSFGQLHSDAIWWLAELPDGNIASGAMGDDPKLKIWSPVLGNLIREISLGHQSTVYSLCLSQDGLIASGFTDKSIKVWSIY